MFEAKAKIVSSKQVHNACPSCIYSHMTPQTNLLQILSLRTIDYQLGFPEKQRHCSPPNFESDQVFFYLEISFQSNGNSYLVEDGLLALMQ